eukprot:2437765-Rhodomonas_salina.1
MRNAFRIFSGYLRQKRAAAPSCGCRHNRKRAGSLNVDDAQHDALVVEQAKVRTTAALKP